MRLVRYASKSAYLTMFGLAVTQSLTFDLKSNQFISSPTASKL